MSRDTGGLRVIRITDPATGDTRTLLTSLGALAALYHVARTIGPDAVYDIASIAHGIVNPERTEEEWESLRHALDELISDVDQWTDNDEMLLKESYTALRSGRWTRARAAEIARNVLGKPITTDGWRKRVDRWAKDRGLPKIDLPAGRPKAKNMDK